ncbi:hypothetical protein ACJMK2_019275 [Sinanodonta woodiana]|uniref:NmrA-like family domain-containing protein 1 n=1 Tax=Sinanodonta woodiana TaxID=1069815 RepID=A0ABD3UFY9_SINWO
MSTNPTTNIAANMAGAGGKKIIVVFGATGTQGGSVARALLQNPIFAVRAVTRHPDGAAAQELKRLKAEVVCGDMDDEQCLRKILTGAYGCFLVTNYYEHMDMNRETRQGKNVIEACKTNGIKHIIYSGLERTEGSGVDAPVHTFDGKAAVEDYLETSGLSWTSTRIAFYCENFFSYFLPRKTAENKYTVTVPMGKKPIYLMAAYDIGHCVTEIFKDPIKYKGKKLNLAGDKLTIDQVCATFTKHLMPKQFQYSAISVEEYAKMSFPGAEEMSNMFHYFQLKSDDLRDVPMTRKLWTKCLTFDSWVQLNKERFAQSIK